MNTICLLSWVGLILTVNDVPSSAPSHVAAEDIAVISQILRIDDSCTLYCDIDGFPPIIGRNMPVKINGLKAANTSEYNQKIQKFLVNILLEKRDNTHRIHLRNIRRGETFCFLADIEVNGSDLCDLLINSGLATRIIEVKEPESSQKQTPSQPAVSSKTKKEYIASKTSKIFHRIGCSHAKRISEDKAIYFSSRREAEQTGREPCKTCKP